jgi:arsenite methyltransferase
MALTCPIDLDVATLRNEIQTMYGRVAGDPDGEFHFHRGPEYAASRLGYDRHELLPPSVTASFAGVGKPHAIAPIECEGCSLTNVEFRDGDATNLPVGDSTVDVVMSNGVLNLVSDKTRAVREIARVLKRGGRVQIADIVISEVLPDSALRNIDLWTG